MSRLVAATTIRLEPAEVQALIRRRLEPGPGASLAARAIVEAERLGEPRFGLSMLADLEELDRPPLVQTLTAARGRVDGGATLGPLAVAAAVEHAARLARDGDVAFVTVTGLKRLGRLGTYVEWAAERGFVALLAVDSPPAVAPEGGDQAALGTNPAAYAVPGASPIVADFATSDRTEAAASSQEGPIPPRGGLIGTLAAVLVETLTGAVEGAPPSRAGRTAAVLLIRPTDAAATDAFADSLQARLAGTGARWPGESRRRRLSAAGPIDVPVDLHRQLTEPYG